MHNLVVLITIGILLITPVGCAKKPNGAGGKVLAKINAYELTVDDFNAEFRLTAPNKYISGDQKNTRADLLDEVITKKILLQEAQRENFDKDRAFMKEIERYWEQALIKLLVQKKTEEFSRSITVAEREVRDEYDRLTKKAGGKIGSFENMSSVIKDDIANSKMQRMFTEWLAKLKCGADIKIYKENL